MIDKLFVLLTENPAALLYLTANVLLLVLGLIAIIYALHEWGPSWDSISKFTSVLMDEIFKGGDVSYKIMDSWMIRASIVLAVLSLLAAISSSVLEQFIGLDFRETANDFFLVCLFSLFTSMIVSPVIAVKHDREAALTNQYSTSRKTDTGNLWVP